MNNFNHKYKYFKFAFFLLLIFTKLIKKQTKTKINQNENNNFRKTGDVLFISGCTYKELPKFYRYTILHQMEQLKVGGLSSNFCFFLDLDPFLVNDYRFIIFYRCPLTPMVEKSIELAKKLNKRVFCDIDELEIDTNYTKMPPYKKSLTSFVREKYDNYINDMGKILKLCEGAIIINEIIAKKLKNYVPEVFINHIVANEEMFQLSLNAINRKPKIKKKKK